MTSPASTPDGIPLQSLQPSPQRQPNPDDTRTAPKPPNVWSILKDAIGKDLQVTHISLPVSFNEPLSFLQRLAEDLEYSHLLDIAATLAAHSPQRLSMVAAFIVSHYSSTAKRVTKPFNPLLGETFELVHHQRGIALIAEQVSHHPPTSALHCSGRGWTYDLTHEIRSRFLVNSLQVWPHGAVHIRFQDGGHYVYTQAHTFVHNIMWGELWLENGGQITVSELQQGVYSASLTFKRKGMFGDAKVLGDFSGRILKDGKSVRKLSGNWNDVVRVDDETVWKAQPRPPVEQTAGFAMTSWSWLLNAEPDERQVARTDCRLRPDQRALEKGDLEEAKAQKERLESEQRLRRKELGKRDGMAKWFDVVEHGFGGHKEWRYGGGYFKCKLEGFGDDVPSIF